MWRTLLMTTLFVAGCASPQPEVNPEPESAVPANPMEGTFEYVGTLKGQSVLTGGRYVFLYGPADGSAPMTGEAGTYQIARDTATHHVVYSTDSTRVGLVFKWTPESWSADTVAYVVMDTLGQVTGRGRSVRR